MEVNEPSPRCAPKVGMDRTNDFPVDWKLIRVEDAGEVLGGRQRSPSAQGDLTPYLRVANVFAGRIDTSDVLEMPFTANERARFTLRAGDIVLNEGQSLELVGRSAIYHDEPPNCCFQNTLVRFRVGPRTDSNYAQYLFESYLRRGEFSKIALQTTSIAHLGAGRFAQMQFVAPPLEEQKAIGRALADADDLIYSLEQLLTKKRQIKQGTMQELLTGKRRLPGYTSPWIDRRVGSFAPLQRGFDLPSRARRSGEYPVVYSNGILNSHSKFMVKGPGVVTGRSGTIGAVTFVEQNYWPHNTSLWVTDFNGSDPRFVFYLFQHIGLERFATGSGVPTLNRNDVHAFEVQVPVSVGEQAEIAQTLSDFDTELTTLEARLTKALALKQAMAQALLTGRIRLVEPNV